MYIEKKPPKKEKNDLKSYDLAVYASGKFESYFKNRPVPENESADDKKA